MADQIQQYACVAPAQTSDVVFPMQLGQWQVDSIRWRVPPGPNGNLAFHLSISGQQVIPFVVGAQRNDIVADNEWDEIPLTNFPTSGDWSAVATNNGFSDHTFYITFRLTALAPAAGSPAAPGLILPNDVLSFPPPTT